MTTKASPLVRGRETLRTGLTFFRQQSGQPFAIWALIAFLSFISLLILRRELAPGEFGTLNTTLGVIGLATVPLLALKQTFIWYFAQNHTPDQLPRIEGLRNAVVIITQTFVLAWGAISLVLLLVGLQMLQLPRSQLFFFTALNVLVALGGIMSTILCQNQNQLKRWSLILILCVSVRLLLGAGLAWWEPWAESGLAALLLAGFITLGPALRLPAIDTDQRLKALRTLLDRDFLLYFGATFSVLLALFLFSSADRIIAQSWFGSVTNNNIGYVDWPMFDAYQTAGLIGRSLLWGTQPLLLILFAQRCGLTRTTATSLLWFWIYLGVLVAGIIFLIIASRPLAWLFCGADYTAASALIPTFAVAMFPLGLLQAAGIFSIASRRFHECFVLGGGSVIYSVLLFLVGRRPEIMPAYMFGGGLVILMVVLFVAVVRWGRKQP